MTNRLTDPDATMEGLDKDGLTLDNLSTVELNKLFDDVFGEARTSSDDELNDALDAIMESLDKDSLAIDDLSTVELDKMLEAVLQEEQPIDSDATISVSLSVGFDGYGTLADGVDTTEFDATQMHIKEVLRKFQDFIFGPMGFSINGDARDARLAFLDENGQIIWRACDSAK